VRRRVTSSSTPSSTRTVTEGRPARSAGSGRRVERCQLRRAAPGRSPVERIAFATSSSGTSEVRASGAQDRSAPLPIASRSPRSRPHSGKSPRVGPTELECRPARRRSAPLSRRCGTHCLLPGRRVVGGLGDDRSQTPDILERDARGAAVVLPQISTAVRPENRSSTPRGAVRRTGRQWSARVGGTILR